MIHLVLSVLWDSAFAQFGLAGLVLIGAVAVFLWVPLPGARHAAVAVATVCVIFLFLAPKLYIEGIRHEKAKWEAAEAAAERRATQARVDAEREIAAEPAGVPTEPAAGSGAGHSVARVVPARRLRHDRYDRDDR
ncbi:MAG TPA: hypothetical protein VH397_16350 [Xanthobacteraceae bacterium]